MPVISVLSQAADQKVARPFTRASSTEELIELLSPYVGPDVAIERVDTEEPLGSCLRFGQRIKFFAFTER